MLLEISVHYSKRETHYQIHYENDIIHVRNINRVKIKRYLKLRVNLSFKKLLNT